ncbi:peptidoglycan-binding domain-containing protein [Actinomadura chibensis]|nr:peptidoglycan-binding domain-containing protein [Actinomadura chibensis]
MTQTATQAPPFQGRLLKRRQPMEYGDDVEVWQEKMKSRGWIIDVDGKYGPQSESKCKKFQTEKGIQATGVVDADTWGKTWTAPVTH